MIDLSTHPLCRRGLVAPFIVALSAGAMLHVSQPVYSAGTITRVEAAAERPTRNLYSAGPPALSADGRIIAFTTVADMIVPGDTNRVSDVFVRDLSGGQVERVSLTADGGQANGASQNPALSADGRYVAFESRATNLVPGDTNGSSDVFVKDRLSGQIERVSVAADGKPGNGGSYRPQLSADAQLVAFWSEASTLVADDNNGSYENGGYDVFIKDRSSGRVDRLSVSADGEEGSRDSMHPSISAEGRFVAFGSYAPNLVANDHNEVPDVFVKDRQTGLVERSSQTPDGREGDADSFWNPVLNADGRFVAFWSEANNLVPDDTNQVVDIFLKDQASGAVERISVAADGSQANAESYNPSLSADGRFVVFWSNASNLVAGDGNGQPDVFVKDRQTGQVELLSLGADAGPASGASYNPVITPDGARVAFWSEASNLVPGDGNGRADIFVVDRPLP